MNGNTAGRDPFTNNPNMAAGAYLTPGYFGTGQFGAYAPNSYGNAGYGNSGYVPGYGASNAAGSYTAGYPPTNGYDPATQNGQTPSYRRNGMTRSNQFQANGAARPAAQGRTQYGWW